MLKSRGVARADSVTDTSKKLSTTQAEIASLIRLEIHALFMLLP
jgi:hypothetical protein